MDSNYELKELGIKNGKCYYFDDIIKIEEFDLDNNLIDEKTFKRISVYNIRSEILLILSLYILDSII